jgi:hypothetical protein
VAELWPGRHDFIAIGDSTANGIPCRAGEAFDIERRRRDVETGLEAVAVTVFGASVDFEDNLDGLEARLSRIASLGHDPIDVAGARVGAGLDRPDLIGDGDLTAWY